MRSQFLSTVLLCHCSWTWRIGEREGEKKIISNIMRGRGCGKIWNTCTECGISWATRAWSHILSREKETPEGQIRLNNCMGLRVCYNFLTLHTIFITIFKSLKRFQGILVLREWHNVETEKKRERVTIWKACRRTQNVVFIISMGMN